MNKNIILKKIIKLKTGSKKYEAIFEKNNKIIKRKFGAKGMSDYTIHKDKKRRERYISRHKKDLRTKDPTRAGYLSMYILWNKPSFKSSIADYKKRLNSYNKNGKFPLAITGSKLKFGGKITLAPEGQPPQTLFDLLPYEIILKIQKEVSSSEIQAQLRIWLKSKDHLKKLLDYYWKVIYTPPSFKRHRKTEPWLILNVQTNYTVKWLKLLNNILNPNDIVKNNFWYNCILSIIDKFIRYDENIIDRLTKVERTNFNNSAAELIKFLKRIFCWSDYENEFFLDEIYEARECFIEEYALENQFGKSKNEAPDNVKNPKLYLKIKAKIKKDVKKKNRRWGAYDSGRLVREYKNQGGKYSGSKTQSKKSSKSSNLNRWYREKWIDACAWPKRKSCGRTKASIKSKVTYCRPSKVIDSNTPKTVQELSKAQIKKRCNKKSKNPKKIIR